jgi:hypothetical protein
MDIGWQDLQESGNFNPLPLFKTECGRNAFPTWFRIYTLMTILIDCWGGMDLLASFGIRISEDALSASFPIPFVSHVLINTPNHPAKIPDNPHQIV